jgi:hypothetical protein
VPLAGGLAPDVPPPDVLLPDVLLPGVLLSGVLLPGVLLPDALLSEALGSGVRPLGVLGSGAVAPAPRRLGRMLPRTPSSGVAVPAGGAVTGSMDSSGDRCPLGCGARFDAAASGSWSRGVSLTVPVKHAGQCAAIIVAAGSDHTRTTRQTHPRIGSPCIG